MNTTIKLRESAGLYLVAAYLDFYPVRAEYVIKCKFEIREMVNFELGKEIKKDVFSSFHERTSQC